MSDQSEAQRNAGFVEASRLHGKEILQLRARIEADEALMRSAAESLNDLSLGLCDDVRIARCEATITALRKRLESSK